MSQRLMDKMTPLIEEEVAKYGDQFSWEYTLSVIPTPQGLAPMGVFIMTMKNPLLGTGDMVAIQPIIGENCLSIPLVPEQLAAIVSSGVQQLRELHARNLDVTSVPGLITP